MKTPSSPSPVTVEKEATPSSPKATESADVGRDSGLKPIIERTCIHHTDAERAEAWEFNNARGCPVCAKSQAPPAPVASVEHTKETDSGLKEAASDNVKAIGQNELPGLSLIAAERQRQVTKEGWTPEHDDQHDPGELAVAGMCYAAYAGNLLHPNTQGDGDWRTTSPEWWPWDEEWWKPTDEPLGSLVKAGALIAAEIDRLLRLNPDCAPSVALDGQPSSASGVKVENDN